MRLSVPPKTGPLRVWLRARMSGQLEVADAPRRHWNNGSRKSFLRARNRLDTIWARRGSTWNLAQLCPNHEADSTERQVRAGSTIGQVSI
jgi:hypothetical protein